MYRSHDYEDSMSLPEGNNRGACVFAQATPRSSNQNPNSNPNCSSPTPNPNSDPNAKPNPKPNPNPKPKPNQTAVMTARSTRDGRRQSRMLRGNKDGFEVCTVNHAKGGEVRPYPNFNPNPNPNPNPDHAKGARCASAHSYCTLPHAPCAN